MKKTVLRSVLYNMATTIPPKEWNEDTMLEWAYIAAKKMSPTGLVSKKTDYLEVKNFQVNYDKNLEYLDQLLVYKNSIDKDVLKEDETAKEYVMRNQNTPNDDSFWKKLNASQNQNKWLILHKNPHSVLLPCYGLDECRLLYSIDENDHKLKFSFSKGIVVYSYMKQAENSDGDILIPDDENFKDAIINYCFYRYFDKMMKADPNQINQNERQFHLQRYDILSRRAIGDINEKNIDKADLENIRKQAFSGKTGFNFTPLFKNGF